MKFLKKAISLVLVFAMLASFAGMTGYKYSPMSITAEAITVGVATVHALPGGVTLTMADSLYKHNGTDHVMQYIDYYEDTDDDGKNDKKNTLPTADGDYGIPADINDMGMKFVFSTAATSLDVRCSLTANPDWSTAVGYTVSNQTTWNRTEDTVMTDEYGSLYKHNLLNKGVGGFRDYGEVYWRFKYTVGGTEYIEYATVKLYDYAKKDDVNAQTWENKPASTGTKPTDSQAAKNKVKFTVPYTLYYDPSNLKIVSSTSDGDVVQEPIYIAVPEGAKNVRLHCVDENGNPLSYNGEEFSFFISENPASDSTNWSKTTIDSKSYYERKQYVDKTVDFIQNADWDKWCVPNAVGTDQLAMLYRLEYDVEETVYNSTEKQTVTYTQYAASNITALPAAYKTAWFADTRRICNSHGSSSVVLCMYNLMDFSSVLATRGAFVETSLRSDDGNLEGETYVKKGGSTYDSWTLSSYTIGFSWDPSGEKEGHWLSGKTGGATPSYEIPGAVIHYDPQAVNTLSFNLTFNQYKSPGDSTGTYEKDKTICAHNLQEYSEGWNVKSAYDGKVYYNDGTDWEGSNVSALDKISYYHTDNVTYSESDMKTKGITTNGVTANFGVYKERDSSQSKWEANATRVYTIDTGKWSGSAAYLQLVTGYTTRFDHTNGWGTKCYNNSLRQACGWFIDLIPVNRTNAHDYIDEAIASNYVKAEMDSAWWDDYREEVFAAYLVCGNLTSGDSGDLADTKTSVFNPKYVFANYDEIWEELTTVAPFDRGGATTDGTNAVTDGLPWGDQYAKYNSVTYQTNSTTTDGKYTGQEGAVSGSLAAYDLKFKDGRLYISDEIRTGEYYYTAASWKAYEDARFAAMNAYNYPTKAPKTAADYDSTIKSGHDYDEVKFDYNETYPQKEATNTASNGAGLACYCKAEIDAAYAALVAARAGLAKKGENGNTEYKHLDHAYTYLVQATSAACYDGVDDLRVYEKIYTNPATNETETRPVKHGLAGIFDSTIVSDDGNQHDYQVASLMFRANHPDDVFDYVFTEDYAKLWNSRYPNDQVSSGAVRTDEDGNPLFLINKGANEKDYEDDEVELASSDESSEYYDVGILSFPKADGTRGPVGRGNTFTQLVFDNSDYSTKAVDNMRKAIANRLNWGRGGANKAYAYLKMVEGAYQGDPDAKDELGNAVKKMTEEDLINNPGAWVWEGIEHRDDILRATYALTMVAPTVRLATSYRQVEEILNNQDNDSNRSDGEVLVPPYDIGGSVYNDKQLWNVTIFHDDMYTGSFDKEEDAFEYNNRKYNTTGKTWYTESTWNTFVAARDELAKLIFNGSVTGGISDKITQQYNTNEIKQNFAYQNMLGQTHYTYDQYNTVTKQKTITRVAPKDDDTEAIKNFVGYYTNGHYVNQQAINEDGISNLAADANGQAKVNALVDAYYTALKNLKLKNLDVYEWEAYDKTGVSTIKAQVQSMLTTATAKQDFYDFETQETDGTITGATLDETKEIYLYNPNDVALIEAYAAAVLAEEASASNPNLPYDGGDNLGDKAAAFDSALKTFNDQYNKMVNGAKYYDQSSWDELLAHLSTLAGKQLEIGKIKENIAELYDDVTITLEDGTTTKLYTVVGDAATTYVNMVAASTSQTNPVPIDQAVVNSTIKQMYDALNRAATATQVTAQANATLAYPEKAEFKFDVYNYTSTARAGSSIEVSRFTDESIAILKNGGTVDGVEIVGANDYLTYTYPILSTYFTEVENDITAVTNLKNIKGTEGGVLEYRGAVTMYLEQAIAYAESQLYDVVDGEKVVKNTTATSPTGKTYPVPNFTEESIAQLEAVIKEAQAAIDAKLPYEDQLEIDKLTWFVYDETTDSTSYLLVGNAAFYAQAFGDPYKWETVDGTLVRTNKEKWPDSRYEELLYGTRADEAYAGLDAYGLQAGPAHYDFLITELTTPYKDGNGEFVDAGKHWGTDGWAITGADGKVSTSSNVFDGTWGAYATYYNSALDYYNSFVVGTPLTVDKQADIDNIAKQIYDSRIALKLATVDFTQDPNYATAKELGATLLGFLQTTSITRYGQKWVEVENAETGEITTELQKSDNPLDTTTQKVYIYNYTAADGTVGITPELEAQIMYFYAMYADDNPDAEFGSWETEGGGLELYTAIKNSLTSVVDFDRVSIKKTDDETLTAGMKDLTENYIAGDWDGTTYTSTLLNQTQIEALNGKDGVEGLLPAAQKLITPLNSEGVAEAVDATAEFGGTLAYATNAIFNYTKNPATNLQFATYMRDNELFAFLDYEVKGSVPFYYPEKEVYDEDWNETIVVEGEYTYKLFDDMVVNSIKANVDKAFAAEKWPAIYQVNNLIWNKDEVYDEENLYYAVAKVEGYDVNESREYEGENSQIEDILNNVASYSSNYIKAITQGVNAYNTDAYFWLVNNAFKTENSVVYILGDASVVKESESEYPYKYDMSSSWFTPGYGCDGYYIFNDADNTSWFIDDSDPEYGVLSTIDNIGFCLGNGFKQEDELQEGELTFQQYFGFDKDTVESLKSVTPIDYYDYQYVEPNKEWDPEVLSYDNELLKNGWTRNNFNNFTSYVDTGITLVDGWATNLYVYMQSLQLRPATEAYREIIQAYYGLQGLKVTEWTGEDSFEVKTIDNVECTVPLDSYVFYNNNIRSKFETVVDGVSNIKTHNAVAGKNPEYYSVSVEDYPLWGQYKTATMEYSDNKANQMKNLTEKFIPSLDTNVFTIDKAVHVYSYVENDDIDSLYEQFVSIASELELQDFNDKWLMALVKALLTGDLSSLQTDENITKFQELSGFTSFASTAPQEDDNTAFYNAALYTKESLLELAKKLQNDYNIIKGVVVNGALASGFNFDVAVSAVDNYKGSYFNTATQPEANELTLTIIELFNTTLVLEPATGETITDAMADRATFAYANPDLFVENEAWETFVAVYEDAEDVLELCGKVPTDDSFYYTKAEHEANANSTIPALATELINARIALTEKGDSQAPEVEISVNGNEVSNFYTDTTAYDGEGEKTNAQKLAEVDPTGAGKPVTGTLFMPNNGGYSLLIYTNEVNPRIVLEIEDVQQKIGNSNIAPSKHETLSISSQRTSGTKTYLVYGTKDGNNVITDVIWRDLKKDSTSEETAAKTGPLEGYKNTAIKNDGEYQEKSSIFAVLAPSFNTEKATASAIYRISVKDVVRKDGSIDNIKDNVANSFVIGDETVDNAAADGTITVYIYYHNSMPAANADGTVNDEGIVYDAVNNKVSMATPAHGASHVPSVIFGGEMDYNGAWRNRVMLNRAFDSTVRSWEFMSIIKDGSIGTISDVAYTDPDFGDKNLGSFYYVIKNGTQQEIEIQLTDEQKAGKSDEEIATLRAELAAKLVAERADELQQDKEYVINSAIIAGYGSTTATGLMNYSNATTAKELMIDYINDEVEDADGNKVSLALKVKADDTTVDVPFDVVETLKASDNFYVYGAEDANGNYVNWAQALYGKVKNGDLVFVHVVDRWGNVVNRIIEINNYDVDIPSVTASGSNDGKITISEAGGSGLKDITVHNGDFSLGDFDYKVDSKQNIVIEEKNEETGEEGNNNIVSHVTVACSANTLTLSKLVPGKTYYIGAIDTAGNTGSDGVQASEGGEIIIEITKNEMIVESGEDMSFNGSSTFTLNGTDTIILNSGEASSVINADIEGNVFANRLIIHTIKTYDTVTGLKTVHEDGTVEEWTTDNATVKNNGDGTLTWSINRRLTEGEHNYKVYAKVDGEYEKFYAPATITATSRSITLTYMVSGVGRMVLKYSGSSSIKNSTYKSTTVPYGSKVTITADTNVEGCEFYYWINNTTERIISTADVYEFKAVSNVNYTAQFTNNSTYTDGKKFVVYVNNAKNVIERFELADGESYTVPTGPVLPDYTFKGWSMTKAEVLASDKDTVIVEPIYELNASNTVTITEGNYTATGAGTYTAEDNQRAVVTISTSAKDGDGKEFLYWIDADTDEIVSYDRTYSFFCVKDTELTPVYGDKSAITAEPIVRITEVKFNALSGKVSFFAERSVPEEFMILQTGIVVTKTESIGTNEEVFVVGGTSTAAGTSTSTANNGYYSANIAVATGQTVWARAYVIYETADGEIFEAYGPVVSYTVD